MTYATPKTLSYPLKSHPGISGPKPKPPEMRSKKRGYGIYLLPHMAAAIRAYGDGSLSRGIEEMYAYLVRTRSDL